MQSTTHELGVKESPLALLNHLDQAIALCHLNYYPEVAVILKKTVLGYENILGTFHPEVPSCYQVLQKSLLFQGKVAEGIAAGEVAKSRAERVFGLTHKTTLGIHKAVAGSRIEAQESGLDLSKHLN